MSSTSCLLQQLHCGYSKITIEAAEADCASVTCSNQSRVEDVIFITLRFVQTLSDSKVIDRIKKKLFGATTITRKIIFEGGLVVVDDGSGNGSGSGSGSGAVVGDNDAPLTVDVTVEATAEQYNITVNNPSTISKEEEKVKPISLGERKNYTFEGFNISDKAPKKLTNLINDYSEWIADGLLKHHADSLLWHLVNEIYIPINYGDEFYWVLAFVGLKERRIQVYDSMLRRRHSGPSFEIQKLTKILPTYLDISGFLDQKVRTDWSMIEAYWDKIGNLFNVEYIEGISQQPIGSRDCDLFVAAYVKYLSDELQGPNDRLGARLLRKRYAALLWKYGEAKS
ncbi:hypothetical protein BC332_25181 [Capsicum chinense]|nr:hypothetical protein BC332_25181 [Capsicum chinense]